MKDREEYTMICERCKKNEAAFFYHENVNGNEKTYRLCPECAAEMEKKGELKTKNGFEGFDSIFTDSVWNDPFKSMNALLSGFIGGGKQVNAKTCSGCGMTFRELADGGMAGCAECYSTFSKELESTFAKLHGHVTHRGRLPSRFREKQELKEKIASLEKERDEAVRCEDYEKAAQIRDELKNLRGVQ